MNDLMTHKITLTSVKQMIGIQIEDYNLELIGIQKNQIFMD